MINTDKIKSTCTIGMTKANVLPLPVGAEQQMSHGLTPALPIMYPYQSTLDINSGIILACTAKQKIALLSNQLHLINPKNLNTNVAHLLAYLCSIRNQSILPLCRNQ